MSCKVQILTRIFNLEVIILYIPYVVVSEKHNPRLAQQCTKCEFLQYDDMADFHWRCYHKAYVGCDYHYEKEDSEDYDGPGYYLHVY